MKLNTLLITMCGLAASLSAGNAMADWTTTQEAPYVAIDYSRFTYKDAGSNASMPSAAVRVGSVVLPHLAIEMQAGASFKDGTISVPGATYNFNLHEFAGVYLRPQVALGPVTGYVLAGFDYQNIKYHTGNNAATPTSGTQENTSGSYGAGASLTLHANYDVSADYMHYGDGLTAVSVGLVYHIN